MNRIFSISSYNQCYKWFTNAYFGLLFIMCFEEDLRKEWNSTICILFSYKRQLTITPISFKCSNWAHNFYIIIGYANAINPTGIMCRIGIYIKIIYINYDKLRLKMSMEFGWMHSSNGMREILYKKIDIKLSEVKAKLNITVQLYIIFISNIYV